LAEHSTYFLFFGVTHFYEMNNTTTILNNTQNIYSIAPSMDRHAPLAAATHDAAQRFEKLAQRILARHSHGGTEMGLLR
jgi:hypothetical protein